MRESKLYIFFLGMLMVFLLAFTPTPVTGQDNYYNTIGLRGGNPFGVTYKQFIGRFGAIEGIAGLNFSFNDEKKLGFTITGLYEYHIYLTEGLNVYGGAGLTLGGGKDIVGIINGDLLVGIEYTVPNWPMSFSADYKPYYSVLHRDRGIKGIRFNEYAISIRYILQR